MPTFAQARMGSGGVVALSKTQIGADITLPAGGPWTIFGIWGNVAKRTTLPDEGSGGRLIIEAKSGDLTPDPAPGKYPLIGNSATNSANSGQTENALNIWPVNWQASGKAVISLSYQNITTITTGSAVAAGIIFGDAIPEKRPLVFCDGVSASFASATEQSVGSITLAEKATRIVGIFADINKLDAWTTGEPIIGTIRLASDDIKLPPSQYPFNRAFNAPDGTAVGGASTGQAQFIPVDIPVIGGSIIDIFATTLLSVTGNADVNVYIAYE